MCEAPRRHRQQEVRKVIRVRSGDREKAEVGLAMDEVSIGARERDAMGCTGERKRFAYSYVQPFVGVL